MKLLGVLLRTAWVAAGLAAIVAWGIAAFMTSFTFLVGYGNPPGTYTGQMDDRQGAWSFLIILTVLSVIVVLGIIWPLTRWRRRRAMAYAAGSHPEGERDEQPSADANHPGSYARLTEYMNLLSA